MSGRTFFRRGVCEGFMFAVSYVQVRLDIVAGQGRKPAKENLNPLQEQRWKKWSIHTWCASEKCSLNLPPNRADECHLIRNKGGGFLGLGMNAK